MNVKPIPPLGLGPIGSVPVHELVYRQLTRALMAGQITTGRKLTSRKLALELDISDMPVRAALSRLQALKALVPLRNGSMVLPSMTRDRFADLMQTRLVCEGAATEKAAAHMTQADLDALSKIGADLTKAARDQDIDQYLVYNYEFKFLIYRACGSETLLFLIETLWLQVGPFLRAYSGQFGGDLAGILHLDHHGQVVEALARRDGTAAAAAMRRDISDGASYLLANAEFC
jgi:DNA-binding GntR family transcriptional regulator